MTGWHLADDVFALLAAGDAPGAAELLTSDTDPMQAGLAAVVCFWRGDFVTATACGERARSTASPADVRALAGAATSLAAAGNVRADGRGAWQEAMTLLEQAPDAGRPWSAVRYVLAEAALVSARLADAHRALASGPAPADAWAGHAFEPMMRACDVRVAVFSGDIQRATDLLVPMRASAPAGTRLAHVIEAVAGVVLGNADDADGVRRTLGDPRDGRGSHGPRDFVDRGVLLLNAFAAVAIGDSTTAARLVFAAGDDGDLRMSTIIDRVLGFELFLVAALEEHDAAAAQTWLGELEALADHPIASPTVQRCRARALLATGDAAAAIAELTASLKACRDQGRGVEAAEGEIVLARARIAARDVASASRDLRSLVERSDAAGHRSVRRSAGTALQTARRRLPPVAGSGWNALSAREREVAEHLLLGHDVDEIAGLMFLAPGTVRTHLSRVLCAFGVPTRIGFLATARRPEGEPPTPVPAALSARQSEVAALVASGARNHEIAETLGISAKGVEKHVSDVLTRWQVRSRFGIARIWWAAQP